MRENSDLFFLEKGFGLRRVNIPGSDSFGFTPSSIGLPIEPASPEEFLKLSDTGIINPNRIEIFHTRDVKFSPVQNPTGDMIENILKDKDIPPVRIANIDSRVVALDPDAVIAHRATGRNMKFRKANRNEILTAVQERQKLLKIRKEKREKDKLLGDRIDEFFKDGDPEFISGS